ncbi:hypothetical protein BJ138DRAFT_1110678 [Hygrophoropsis aurantiaca]|uniref:Uncharacterized protein n=1 Tax=Hygrophoropsis aurantiaca TaxID=72124 RepID=A0ACB8ALE6_9AGAM|nr:hypothetical protein BJ138DRAFT_1110678 [Hygrophoropsis aurantiaca]
MIAQFAFGIWQLGNDPLRLQDLGFSVAWSPDLLSIVSGDDKGNVRLWTLPPLERNITANNPLLPSTSRSRANSVSSSILNLPAVSSPTPPQSNNVPAEEDKCFGYGKRPAQRRKKRRRRAPPISVVHNVPTTILNPAHYSPPLDKAPSPPTQATPDMHAVVDAPARVGALRRLWKQKRTLPRWTRRMLRKNHDEPRESQPVEPSPPPNAPTNNSETQPQPNRAVSPYAESPAGHAGATAPRSRIMPRLPARPKRRPADPSTTAENIEMHPLSGPRCQTRDPPPHTRPRRRSQSEVVTVAAGRLDQRLAASSNKWTDKIDWLDYICFCMCCPWNKVVSDSDSERQGNQTAAGAGAEDSSDSSSSLSLRSRGVNLNDIF